MNRINLVSKVQPTLSISTEDIRTNATSSSLGFPCRNCSTTNDDSHRLESSIATHGDDTIASTARRRVNTIVQGTTLTRAREKVIKWQICGQLLLPSLRTESRRLHLFYSPLSFSSYLVKGSDSAADVRLLWVEMARSATSYKTNLHV